MDGCGGAEVAQGVYGCEAWGRVRGCQVKAVNLKAIPLVDDESEGQYGDCVSPTKHVACLAMYPESPHDYRTFD